MTHSLKIRTIIITALLLLGAPLLVTANSECAFTRTLSLGDTGEDVRCLQVFLNASGFQVASSGVGSPGNETTTYGSLTEAAVLRWQQANSIAGANGNFGPASQARYASADTSSVVELGTDDENLNRIISDLQQQLAAGLSEINGPVPQVAGVSDSASVTLDDAMAAFTELVTDIQELDEDMEDVTDTDLRSDALNIRLNLYNGLIKLFSGDYAAANRLANALIEDVDEVMDDVEEANEVQSVQDLIDDVKRAYRDADDEVDDAEDNDESGADDARDLLDEAKDLLDDAEDALDDEDWEEAEELAEEAEELIEEALEEL